MENKLIEILILTRSILLEQGLFALLESLPEIHHVKAIKELRSAYEWIGSHKPKIVLLDITLAGSNPRPVLAKIQTLSHETQRVLLVDDVEESKLVPQYTEAILIKGASPSAVTATITNLLSSKGVEHEHNDSNQ